MGRFYFTTGNKIVTTPATYILTTKRGAFVLEVKTECNGTRAESRFGLPAKRTSPFMLLVVTLDGL